MSFSHSTFQPLAPGQEVATPGEILSHAANTYPTKCGLIDGANRWTFQQLDRLANQFANAIIEKFADVEGPVGIIGKNSAEYVITHFGTARTGRYAINFPTRCTQDDLIFTIGLTKPVALMVDTDCWEMIQNASAHFDADPLLICIGDQPGSGAETFWRFFGNQPETPPDIEISPDAGGSVVFTGGTTGRPKAAISSHRARAVSAMAAVEDFRITSDVVAGYSVPFTHTAGLFSWFQPAVLAGCTGVIIPKWDPELFMQLTEQHGINVIFAVPAQLATLLNHPNFNPERLHSLRTIVFGGAPLSKTLIDRAENAMPWMTCARAYGSTETGHLAAQIKSDRAHIFDGYNQPGGRLEIEIFTEPGVKAKQGEIGEVATRGAHLMTEYLENDAAQAAFFKSDSTDGQWGWMGDLAVKHDGYFTLVGRSKHMILSGGLNIFPNELEDILIQYPGITDCVVFGIEDETWGELPAAAITIKPDHVETDAVLEFVAEKVARYKRLRKIFIVDDIPRTGAGKAQIHLIKQHCLATENKSAAAGG